MADFTTVQKSSSTGWIIGAIAVVLVLLFIVFAGGSGTTTGDGTLLPEGTPAIDSAPAAVPVPAPAPAE